MLGGWSISEKMYKWICKNLPEGSKILEFGSGYGSHLLSKKYDVTCIDHDNDYIGKYDGIKYYKKRIEDGFYKLPQKTFKNKHYDLILIDGPPEAIAQRSKFLNHLEKFNFDNTIIIIDDVHRKDEFKLHKLLCAKLERYGVVYEAKNKSFSILKP